MHLLQMFKQDIDLLATDSKTFNIFNLCKLCIKKFSVIFYRINANKSNFRSLFVTTKMIKSTSLHLKLEVTFILQAATGSSTELILSSIIVSNFAWRVSNSTSIVMTTWRDATFAGIFLLGFYKATHNSIVIRNEETFLSVFHNYDNSENIYFFLRLQRRLIFAIVIRCYRLRPPVDYFIYFKMTPVFF